MRTPRERRKLRDALVLWLFVAAFCLGALASHVWHGPALVEFACIAVEVVCAGFCALKGRWLLAAAATVLVLPSLPVGQ